MTTAMKCHTLHPTRFSDGDLSDLATMARQLQLAAPVYSAWLLSVVELESDRRELDDHDAPREPRLATIPVQAWSDADLLDALLGQHVAGCVGAKMLSANAAQALADLQLSTIAECRRRFRNTAPTADALRADADRDLAERLATIDAREKSLDALVDATLNHGPTGWARFPEIDAETTWAREQLETECDAVARQKLQWLIDYSDFTAHKMRVALRDHANTQQRQPKC